MQKKASKAVKLPCATCGGKCCRYAPIETRVWKRVKHKVQGDVEIYCKWEGEPKEAWFALKRGTDGECAFLQNGRCSIYSMRPRSCRAVGVLIPCSEVDKETAARQMEVLLEVARRKGIRFIRFEGE